METHAHTRLSAPRSLVGGHRIGRRQSPSRRPSVCGRRGEVVGLIDIRRVAGLHFYAARPDSEHPWISALSAATTRHAGVSQERLVAALSENIHSWRPKNAAEYFGLACGRAPLLEQLPAWAAILPWEAFSIEESLQRQARGRRIDTGAYGQNLGIDQGSEAFGPSSPSVVDLCSFRLMSIVDSIRRRGVDRRDGKVRIVALRDTFFRKRIQRTRFYVENGQHRLAVYAYLGIQSIPCKIVASHSRSESASWPAVRRGYFDEEAASEIFRRMHQQAGRPK